MTVGNRDNSHCTLRTDVLTSEEVLARLEASGMLIAAGQKCEAKEAAPWTLQKLEELQPKPPETEADGNAAQRENQLISDYARLCAVSRYVRIWVQRQPDVKEESLTDWLLFDLSQQIPRITYRTFSRHKEARKTGADWEWWFLFQTFAFKMRVQAKKLFPYKDHYKGIAYKNRYGRQIERLLDDAKLENFMPFYAFYTAETADVMCQVHRNAEGVFIAGGNSIYDEVISVPRRPISSQDLLKHSLAISCFFCPVMVAGNVQVTHSGLRDSGDGLLRFIERYYASERTKQPEDGEENEIAIPGVHRQIPPYVESFVKAGNKDVTDWWEREFHQNIKNVDALLVYDARE